MKINALRMVAVHFGIPAFRKIASTGAGFSRARIKGSILMFARSSMAVVYGDLIVPGVQLEYLRKLGKVSRSS